MGLALNKRAVVLVALILSSNLLFAQHLPINPNAFQDFIRNLPSEILKYRQQLIEFINRNQIYFLASLLAVPLILFLYFDARLIFSLLRELTYLFINRNVMLPIEKRWYLWRISMKVIGILFVSGLIILLSGWLAWILQFKNINEMIKALEELRRTQNPLKILETLLRSLRRR